MYHLPKKKKCHKAIIFLRKKLTECQYINKPCKIQRNADYLWEIGNREILVADDKSF